jgi:trimethylamine-N-oxide reductase (cytochrome c)
MDHTWLRNFYEIAQREPVWINPADAEARDIENGDLVRIFNERGSLLAGAWVTERIRPGVIRLEEGGWYDPLDPKDPKSLDKHGNANTLTLDKGTSSLAQSTSAHTTLVQIERYTGAVPDVTAFDPPPTQDRA